MRGFAISCLILFSPFVHSQTKVGISGGATSADFNYKTKPMEPSYEESDKIGFNGGLKLDVPLIKEVLKLTPELFINQNGSEDEYYTSFAQLRDSLSLNKVNLDYVGIYFPLKINLKSSKGTGVYFIGAGYADYTLTAKLESEVLNAKTLDFRSSKDRFDWGYRFFAWAVVYGECRVRTRI